MLADSEAEAGQATADELGAAFIRTDISQMADAEAAVALAVGRHGRLDIIVQNAGIYPWQLIENTSPDDWDASWLSIFAALSTPHAPRSCR